METNDVSTSACGVFKAMKYTICNPTNGRLHKFTGEEVARLYFDPKKAIMGVKNGKNALTRKVCVCGKKFAPCNGSTNR